MSDHTALREILEAELRIAEEVSRRGGVPLGPVQLSQRVVREAIAALAPPADPEALARKIALRLAAAWDAFPEGAKATWATGIIKDMLLADRAAAAPAPDTVFQVCHDCPKPDVCQSTDDGRCMFSQVKKFMGAAVPAPEGLDTLTEKAAMFCVRSSSYGEVRAYLDGYTEVVLSRARPALSDETLYALARQRCREYAEKFTQQDLVEFARAVLARQQERR